MGWIGWLQIGISIVSGSAAGILSALAAVARVSKWQQRVDDQIETIQERLDNGEGSIDDVRVQEETLEGIGRELKEIKGDLRTARTIYVSRRECDMRHNRRELVEP